MKLVGAPCCQQSVLQVISFGAPQVSLTLRSLAQAKADNDVTIILKPLPGTKRVQPLQHAPRSTLGPQRASQGANIHNHHQQASRTSYEHYSAKSAVEPNYTIILGSHRNSCLKVSPDCPCEGSFLTWP